MKIYLCANNKNHRGPGMVYTNLVKGLQKLDDVQLVSNVTDAEYIGCLQISNLDNIPKERLSSLLYGPNMFVHPDEIGPLLSLVKTYLLPSQWSVDITKQSGLVDHIDFKLWSVGIDTDEWKPLENKKKTQDCLLYVKNRSAQDRFLVESLLKKHKLSYQTVIYGSYAEHDFKQASELSKFAVLLTNTESQGIAYMQILSSGIPCYVFNQTEWQCPQRGTRAPATSVPYFDSRCGEISNDIDLEHFSSFIQNVKVGKYSPRDYIMENHTLQQSAECYVELLKGKS